MTISIAVNGETLKAYCDLDLNPNINLVQAIFEFKSHVPRLIIPCQLIVHINYGGWLFPSMHLSVCLAVHP